LRYVYAAGACAKNSTFTPMVQKVATEPGEGARGSTETAAATMAENASAVTMVSRQPSLQSLLMRSQVFVQDSPGKPRMNSLLSQGCTGVGGTGT